MSYLRARTLDEVLGVLAQPGQRRIVCGATDVYADAALVPANCAWVDISGIDALRGIERRDDTIRVGAACTWEAIAQEGGLPRALTQAAASVGSRPIRIQGTIGGNLCHASPVADGIPPLLALGAYVELASVRGVRRLPLSEFLLGGRRTALCADEVLVAVAFALPRSASVHRTAFVKCANRDGSALAVVSAAVSLYLSEQQTIDAAAVAVGGASKVALRTYSLEALLMGRRFGFEVLTDCVETASFEELSPIDDCRATASHRMHLARVAVRHAIGCCIEEGAHGASTA